jgi:transposase
MDTSQERRRKKRWPDALKREIVAATLQPGASVSVIARQYDVNANQVFSWRRQYRELARPSPDLSKPGLVAVTITPDPAPEAAAPPTPGISDAIEIEVCGTYRIRVGSNFDCRALKRVLDVLRRR